MMAKSRINWRRVVLLAALVPLALSANETSLLIRYTFDGDIASRVVDSSGNGLDGEIVGSIEHLPGVRGNAIVFDGFNRIRTEPPHFQGISTLLNLDEEMTIVAWFRGRGGEFRLVRAPSSYPSIRGPDFQVCGEVVHLTFSSDHPSRENPNRQGYYDGKWNDWHIWTGTADINLSNWRDQQRTYPPFSGVEPKLVVHGSRIFYEFFGQDANGVWQIYTGQSNIDGSDWKTTQRTYKTEGYRTEQLINLQVVSGRVQYAWKERDDSEQWQVWTASSALDGTEYKASQRTTAGGGIPQLQAVGNKIYYLYSTPALSDKKYRRTAAFAVSDLDGNGWRVVRTIEDVPFWYGGIGAFQISDGRVYFTYNQVGKDGYVHLFTGEMDVEGRDFRAVQRTFGETNSGIPQGGRGIQVVGDKIHYIFHLDDGKRTLEEHYSSRESQPLEYSNSVWTAISDRDGSNWKATQRTKPPPSLLLGYQGIQVFGGKSYYAGFESPPIDNASRQRGDRYHAVLGTSGSNIISKGDAFGLGLSEQNELSGFINAGQGYLHRGEAPLSTSGAAARYPVDDKWHFAVMTYDRANIKLYVDGQLQTVSPYKEKTGRNPFPLLIGDGFRGVVDEVSIYGRVASPKEIADWYKISAKVGE